MHKYVLKRLLQMILVLFGVSVIVFALISVAPGDAVHMILGQGASVADVAAMREKLGLNDPFILRYVHYIGNIVTRFDFGDSYFTGRPVMTEIMARFPNTVILAVLGISLSVLFGVAFGIVAATRQYSIFDKSVTVVGLLGVSMPSFWLGLMLIVLFAVQFKILPASGSYGPKYWILPALTIGANGAANIMRMTRSSMLETIRQDYIRTAVAKGQTRAKVIINHALMNALIPIVTVIGLQFGLLLGVTTVVVETVFAIPGIGKYLIDAIKQRDTPVIMGLVLFMAMLFSLVNLLIDILYAYIDPRIKSQYE